jgi:hypothetical protein
MKPTPAFPLSIMIALLATLASAGGLFLEGVYRDNLLVTSVWRGNDLITLAGAVPALVLALAQARRGSLRGYLVWLGMLDYMLYNYAFYLFGAAFNWFFLIYAALVALSIFTLIIGLVQLDVAALGRQFRAQTPRKFISAYLLLSAIGLSVVYVTQSLQFIFTGQLPAIVTRTGHPTSIVFALDLTLLIPFLLVGAIWLLQRKPWGYVLAGILTVKGPAYTLAVGSWWAARAGVPDATAEIPLWIFLTGFGLVAGGLLYWNLDARQSQS